MQTRLLLAFQDEVSALAMKTRLEQQDEAGLSVQTTDWARLLQKTATDPPDVLILQHPSGATPAPQALLPWQRLSPTIRTLLLCEACTVDVILACTRLAASGCVLRTDAPAVLIQAVRSIHGGNTWYQRSDLLQAAFRAAGPPPVARRWMDESRLTQREDEIFGLLAHGLTNKEIARELQISDLTVKTHLHRIYVKLHQSGRHKAVLSVLHGHAPPPLEPDAR